MDYTRFVVTALAVTVAVSVVFVGGAAAQTAPDCSAVSYDTDDGTYLVENIEELQCIGDDEDGPGLNEDYRLNNEIEASDTVNWNDGNGFEPIGDSDTPFEGTFDGDGNTINELTVNRTSEDEIGLFGYTYDAEITNIELADVDIEGYDWAVGGLVGWMEETDVSEVTVSGEVSADEENSWATGGIVGASYSNSVITEAASYAEIEAAQGLGGLVGEADETVIEDSYAEGDVTGSWYGIGGAIGAMWNGEVHDTEAHGDVDEFDINPACCVGGFAGELAGGDILVTNSVATGDVAASDCCVGGFANIASATVKNSYATGDVYGNDNGWHGGFAGWTWTGSNVTQSAATGDVTYDEEVANGTGEYVGGFVGVLRENVSSSYATGDVMTNSNRDEDVEVGGFAGEIRSDGYVKDSYAHGDVTGYDYVGGFGGILGWNSFQETGGVVENVYSTGKPTAEGDNVGGLLGFDESATAASVETAETQEVEDRGPSHERAPDREIPPEEDKTTGTHGVTTQEVNGVIDSYWDEEASGTSDSDGGTPLTTEEMTGDNAPDNMLGFDFMNTWATVTDDYPILQNSPDITVPEDVKECVDRRSLARGQEDDECPTDRDLRRGDTRGDLDREYDRDSDTARRDHGRDDGRSRGGTGR